MKSRNIFLIFWSLIYLFFVFVRTQGTQDISDIGTLKMLLEEKEQALLSSQETVQVHNLIDSIFDFLTISLKVV